jgi:cobalt/nickel transport system ATP-binding protein
MHLHLDQYAHLGSPIHRWHPRSKFIALFLLIIAFSLVRDLRLVPPMLLMTAIIFRLSQLPLAFLFSRLRYPGIFLLALVVILPLFTGQTSILRLGPLSIQSEGVAYMLLVVSRFVSILTISAVIFGTTPFLTTVHTLQTMGIPVLLTDILLLTVRYIFEVADTLTRMQRAMRLRGFQLKRLNRRNAGQLAALLGTLLIRSYEQSERVYQAMRLRGYNARRSAKDTLMQTVTYQAGDTALHLEQVNFAYAGRPPALTEVSLTIRQGERVGLIGPNGAGKSSLFLAICGILKPGSGSVHLYQQVVGTSRFHPEIGLVFQNADDQLFSPTVRDDIAFGPVNLGFNDEAVACCVDEAVRLTSTAHLLDRVPHHLSGGEKRMVSIASVIAMRPGIVLYDEPDASLDMRARRHLIGFLKNAPHTVFVASHDLELILEVCNRVILLDNGAIIADDDARKILGDAALMAAHGLEKPHSLIPHSSRT